MAFLPLTDARCQLHRTHSHKPATRLTSLKACLQTKVLHSLIRVRSALQFCGLWIKVNCFGGLFFFFLLFFLLYNIVLVLPYINMHPPRVYTCSPSWTPLGWQLPGKHADAAAAFCEWRPTGSSPRAARSGCSRWAHAVPTSACRCALSRSSPQSSVWEPCPCPEARTWRRGLRLQCNQSFQRAPCRWSHPLSLRELAGLPESKSW